jgi:hypothetical protein
VPASEFGFYDWGGRHVQGGDMPYQECDDLRGES